MNVALTLRMLFFRMMSAMLPRDGELYKQICGGLKVAFPDASPRGLDTMVRAFSKTYAVTAGLTERIEALPHVRRRKLVRRVVIVDGAEHIRAARSTNRPVLAVTPHFGNGVLHIIAFAEAWGDGPRAIIIDSPKRLPDSISTDRFQREEGWETFFADGSGLRKAIRFMRGPGLVAILPDMSDISRSNVYVPFFDRLILAMPGAAFLATVTNALILPVYGWHEPNGRYRMVVEEPFEPCKASSSEQATYETTALIFRGLEAHVRRRPHEWAFWPNLSQRCINGPPLPTKGIEIRETLSALREMATDVRLDALLSEAVRGLDEIP